VDEPYLTITPNISVLLDALIFRRLTFGEAAYMAQPGLSWQTTVIGDPLYQPFGLPPDVLHLRLERRNSPLVEWSHLRVNNLNQATGLPAKEIMDYLHRLPVTTNSAVLMEKMGDLQRSDGKLSAAAESYASAVNLKPSPMQKLRLLLALGEIHSLIARDAEAFAAYQQLLAEFPDYPERGSMAAKALKLARRLGKSAEVEKFEREIQDAVPAAK
jgi:tetratricopeptide (TPR) repeat protein